MPTDTRTLTATFSIDTDFRLWGSGLNAQIAAVGLVKTADTGQIDWTTVLKPSAGNQKVGYEIWRFNDALQSTKPVFIRIDYGSGSAGGSLPSLWATIGTGTNGAGTVTGQVGSTRAIQASAGSATPSYCSGNASRLSLCTNNGSANGTLILCIERTKTPAGVETGDGIIRYAYSNNNSVAIQLVPYVGVIPPDGTFNPAIDANLGGVSSLGTNVMLSPTVFFYGKPLFASWCSYKPADILALTPITFDHLGATRTYLPLGATTNVASNNVHAASGTCLAMLWE